MEEEKENAVGGRERKECWIQYWLSERIPKPDRLMATNPRTGKTAIMHQACWKKEMDKKREKF